MSVMVEQPENGYKDTALEIAGKGIIKSVYRMLLKSGSTVLYCSSSSMESHIYMQCLIIYNFIQLCIINSFHSGLPQIQNDLHTFSV